MSQELGKELRLSFSMGGGVSRGAFSGAALTEAMKLAILRGKDKSGKLYRKVVVDVFSGASAGALSLGIMLRYLVNHSDSLRNDAKRKLQELFHNDSDFRELERGATEDIQNDATRDLPDYHNRNNRLQDLITAQVIQDIQEKVWVEDIQIEKLLSADSKSYLFQGGILDRKALQKIAKDRISFTDSLDLQSRGLLDDRVLFACTLTNMSPLFYDSREERFSLNPTTVSLLDSNTSQTHKDMRIFDIALGTHSLHELTEEESKYPRRWLRYHNSAPILQDEKTICHDIRDIQSWKTITATCIACGAFPFAFEPVVLERAKEEFGGLTPNGIWPEILKDEDKHCFTYVDGGIFNNEPLTEAFQLSSFIDTCRSQHDFERWIIFVDPNVSSGIYSLNIPGPPEIYPSRTRNNWTPY